MKPQKKNFVVFESAGTLFHETSEKPIKYWNTKTAVRMSQKVVERYGARPFAFHFQERIVSDDIDDGAGGRLKVLPKTVKASRRHFIGGKIETIAEVEERGDPKESILLSNMKCNGWDKIWTSTEGWKVCQPFQKGDVMVDTMGKILKNGV
jgi:hypothetical protein